MRDVSGSQWCGPCVIPKEDNVDVDRLTQPNQAKRAALLQLWQRLHSAKDFWSSGQLRMAAKYGAGQISALGLPIKPSRSELS